MRKIFATVLALTMIFASFAAISVSANSYDITLGEPVYSDDNTYVNIPVIVNVPADGEVYIDDALFAFTSENCTFDSATTTFSSEADFTSGKVVTFAGSATKFGVMNTSLAANDFVICTLKVLKTGDNAKFALASNSYALDSIGGWQSASLNTAAVELWPAGPTENVATYVTNELALDVAGEIKNFTDVPVYEATTTATSFKLKAVYGEEYNYLKFNGAEEINVSNIKVDGDGEVSFQVAIIGVPAGVTIDKLIVE